MSTLVQNPFDVFTDVDGDPLENGYIFIGVVNLNPISNPLQAYWDSALTVPATNIRTKGGYPSNNGTPGRLYVAGNYSILVRDKKGAFVYSQLDSLDYFNSVSGELSSLVDTIASLRNIVSSIDGSGVELKGYYAPGDTQPPMYIWNAGSLADDNGGSVIKPTAIDTLDPGRWEWLNHKIQKVSWWGIVGDGLVDDLEQFTNALENMTNTLDLEGRNIKISSTITVPLKDKVLQNGSILFAGSQSEYALYINVLGSIRVENININGDNFASKLITLFLDDEAVVEVIGGIYTNATQAEGFGLAAGVFVIASTGLVAESVRVESVSVKDISSTATSSPVGRGVFIGEFKACLVTNLDVRRVGPYQDGDGIFCYTTNIDNAVLKISNCYFEDCYKRAVKSQVEDSHITDITIKRTLVVPTGAGQSDIDLQFGGYLDGLRCWYAAGTAPAITVTGGNRGNGVFLSNINIECEDDTDAITPISFSSLTDTEKESFIVDNVHTNALIVNAVKLYSDEGTLTNAGYIFGEVRVSNITGKGFDNPNAASACIQIQRGAAAFVQAKVYLFGINIGTDNTVPISYLNPNAGSTSFLRVDVLKLLQCEGFNFNIPNSQDVDLSVKSYSITLQEDEAYSEDIQLLTNSSIRISLLYSSSRDGASFKLYTEGLAFEASTVVAYVETLAGNKSSTGQGAISITPGANFITVAKTAGTLSQNGKLTILITHAVGIAL